MQRLLRCRQTALSLSRFPSTRLLHGWGAADSGQLGVDILPSDAELETYGLCVRTPRKVAGLSAVQGVAPGAAHTLILANDDFNNSALSVLTCGLNDRGQLGRPPGHDASILAPLPSLPSIAAVAAGDQHSLLLTPTGIVYSFGCNARGQLGRDTPSSSSFEPGIVRSLAEAGARIIAIAAGSDFSVALSDDGAVYTWGGGENGRLGHGDLPSGVILSLMRSRSSDDELRPRRVGSLRGEKAISIFAGVHSAGVLLSTGRFVVFGSGRGGVLGTGSDGDVWEPVEAAVAAEFGKGKQVAFGMQHALFLLEDGRVVGCGQGEFGALGPVDPGVDVVEGIEIPLPEMMGAESVAAGWGVSAAVGRKGELISWGSGSAGALGRGYETADCWEPTAVPFPDDARVSSVCIPATGRHGFAWQKSGVR